MISQGLPASALPQIIFKLYFEELQELTNGDTFQAALSHWRTFFATYTRFFLCDQPKWISYFEIRLDYQKLDIRHSHNERSLFLIPLLQQATITLPIICAAIHEQLLKSLEQETQCLLLRDVDQYNLGKLKFKLYNEKLQLRLWNLHELFPLKHLRSTKIGRLVMVQGSVVRANSMRPLVTALLFQCLKCGNQFSQPLSDGKYTKPALCKKALCNGKLFSPVRNSATTIDWQRIRIQENFSDISKQEMEFEKNTAPSSDVVGRAALTVDCELKQSLVDICAPGDIVNVVGIVKANPATSGWNSGRADSTDSSNRQCANSLFVLYIDALSLQHVDETSNYKRLSSQQQMSALDSEIASKYWGSFGSQNHFQSSLKDCTVTSVIDLDTDSHDLKQSSSFTEKTLLFIRDVYFNEMFKFELLVNSMCPAIYGNTAMKAGIILSLLGGVPIMEKNGRSIKRRGEIHCLLIGDPGLGKSQLLREACILSERGVYVCGNSLSASGLTASVIKESGTGEFALEAGALVLADQGTCCIDELDKMSAQEKHSFLEAMEQQTISIAKAGIVCNLCARAAIVGAANPKDGKYRQSKSLIDNIRLPTALLSRFDMIFLMRDQADSTSDSNVTNHLAKMRKIGTDVVNEISQPSAFEKSTFELRCQHQTDPLPQHLLKAYLRYARSFINPVLTKSAAAVIKKFYLSLRKRSFSEAGTIPITTRQLEAMIRLCEARARADLIEEVSESHAHDVVELYKNTIFGSEEVLDQASIAQLVGNGSRKSLKSLVLAFEKMLEKSVSSQSNQFLYSELMNNAKMLLETVKSTKIDALSLIEAANHAGIILKKADYWCLCRF